MNLVVGATGSLGGRITRGLLTQGKAVRILARNNSISAELAQQGRANTAAALVEAGAQAVYGDLKERASLDAALAGVGAVRLHRQVGQQRPRFVVGERCGPVPVHQNLDGAEQTDSQSRHDSFLPDQQRLLCWYMPESLHS